MEDDFHNLPSSAVKNVLAEILNGQFSHNKYSLSIESGSEKGDNYIGIIYRGLAVENKRCDDSGEKTERKFNVIIKVAPQNPFRRKKFFVRQSFLREALVYDELLPILMEFQESKGVNCQENGFHEFAECYRTITDNVDEAIFMEDLCLKGFNMFNRFGLLTYEHVFIVVRILAKLHAISHAMKDQCPEKLKRFQVMEDLFADRSDDIQLLAYFDEAKRIALSTLNTDNDQFYINRLNEFLSRDSFFNLLMSAVSGSKAEPNAVFCHGDCWINNVLFKNKNGKPVYARLIDWQIARYASPVCDITYYLFVCTTKDFRNKHYHEILDVYYKELSAHLKRLGSDPEKVFPRKSLDSQLKQFGWFGLLMSMVMLPMITNQAADIPDLDELSEKIEAGGIVVNDAAGFYNSNNMTAYNRKMRNIIIDNVDFGYI